MVDWLICWWREAILCTCICSKCKYSTSELTSSVLWQRVSNLYNSHKECNLWLDHINYMQSLLAESLGQALPTVGELVRATSFAFINSNELIEIARPTSHKVKYIGGAALKRPVKLNAKIEAIIEKSKAGVTFNNFPDYEFIVKVTGKTLNISQQVAAEYPNAHLVNWVDQTSLLAHPKTKAFITHCGLNSLNEAAHLVSTMHDKEIGVVLSKRDLTQHTLTNALQDVLHTRKYMDNMQILKRKLEKNPFKPADVFVKTVEYAAELQGDFKELNLAGYELNFVQYFLLDFMIIAAITALTMELLLSEKNKFAGHLDDYLYWKNNTRGRRTRWRCIFSENGPCGTAEKKCPGAASTFDGKVEATTEELSSSVCRA
uniref:glucuronosyltransferase n=1 Tax=Ditylenchus dipsaci TaxID=166011 RepID=A0A915CSG0_9BILA